NAAAIEQELQRFSPTLAARERWLVLNKIDLLPADEVAERCRGVVNALGWTGPVHAIAAINQTGTQSLCGAIMAHIEAIRDREAHDPDFADRERDIQRRMQQEAREKIESLRLSRRHGDDGDIDDDDLDD